MTKIKVEFSTNSPVSARDLVPGHCYVPADREYGNEAFLALRRDKDDLPIFFTDNGDNSFSGVVAVSLLTNDYVHWNSSMLFKLAEASVKVKV